jgi:hypothetical protein
LEFLDWANRKENIYFIGLGDYDDLASASERIVLTDRKLHESSIKTLEGLYKYHTDRLFEEIKFMKGKCLGLIEGNHYAEFQNGTTSTQYLCDKLECKYLGVSSFIRLSYPYGKQSRSLDIFAYHGKGAGRLVGSCLNTVQQMAERAEADIYLMGHCHRKSIGLGEKLVLSGANGTLKLNYRKQLFINTGSFLMGYEPNVKSYVVDAGLNPTSLGVAKIEITPRKKGNDAVYLDIHGSI